jgi:hypothetical protein
MMPRAFRLVFVTLIVSLYAVAQAFCACAAIVSTNVDSQHAAHMQMQTGSSHDHMGHKEPAPSSNSCEHCEDGVSSALVQNAALAPAFKIIAAPVKFAAIDQRAIDFVERLPKSYDKLRWLDPPSLTPVTLKIRLLT